jgi:hypothetical protein
VRCSEEERLSWLPQVNRQVQPHDVAVAPQNRKDNYFVAPRFYCVETICAPCGAVIAWTLFDKAESPTNILHFLEAVYPTPDLRPNYVCIDKACAVLQTSISNGAWNTWNQTTWFIVNSYHYINHHTTDYLHCKWCNPAPLNGSAPNLVIVENDVDGNPHYKHAFNSQACEQLNAWLGGFQPILNRMTIHNFRWFLHGMLFIHTQRDSLCVSFAICFRSICLFAVSGNTFVVAPLPFKPSFALWHVTVASLRRCNYVTI